MAKRWLVGILLCVASKSLWAQAPAIRQAEEVVSLQNEQVCFAFDLARGDYRIIDKKQDTTAVAGAVFKANSWSSSDKELKRTWSQRAVSDELGQGRALDIKVEGVDRPGMIFSVVMYDDQDFLTFSAEIINTTNGNIQIKEISPLADGRFYPDEELAKDFAMVDGFSGGEPLEYGKRIYSPLNRNNALKSRNNIALTFSKGDARHVLVMGGLTYQDFEKFASLIQSRRVELEKGKDDKSSLICYLDLPNTTVDKRGNGETLKLVKGQKERVWQYHEFRCRELATSVEEPERVVIEATELSPGKPYSLGFSWWRGFWHGNHGEHRQSVFIEYGDGKRVPLVKNHLLAQFDNTRKQDVEQVEIPLPGEAIREGSFRIVFENSASTEQDQTKQDKNVYVSEVWLRDGTAAPLLTEKLTSIDHCVRPRRKFTGQLFAKDPVGKRVDSGQMYHCPDRFYLDVASTCPFTALEAYGKRVAAAQKVRLNMYDFPTVCLWYAEVSAYGNSEAENTTLGAVQEMKKIAASGFLKYSRAAVRLVPDSYNPSNQQGWWDDRHWQREDTDRDSSGNGRYVKPFETSKKWGRAVTELGGIPLMYFQTGFRSEDYAEAFPGHMLFNKTYAWKGEPQDLQSELFTDWHKTWARNGQVWGYDYTDPDFLKHLQEVYANLKTGGIKGLMFDYPASGWALAGGMEDPYSTTAAAYRNIFRMPHDGLGLESYVHERNMQRGSDISIGLTASMRTENDTDTFDATTATRCGMRWYKNRVITNQDTDSKNIVKLQQNRDHVRAVLTMAYVTTGRLLLANSFSQFSAETFYDLTRTFPYHTTPRSARPVDAFVSEVPTVYDFEVNPQWHQITFFNPNSEKGRTIGIDLAGEPVRGALGLNPKKAYHVFDFWNDKYIGKLFGESRLEQQLRPGEARMMAVREAFGRPQLLSTNRHVMQGYLDVVRIEWHPGRCMLAGISKVVGEDPCVLTVAPNGFRAAGASCTDNTKTAMRTTKDGLVELTLTRPTNGIVEWVINFDTAD
jgi:hypothetical protein